MPAQCLVVFVAALGACAKEVPIVEVQGECADVFQGQACAWARMQGNTVVDVGATVPLSSIENAPKDAEMAWPPAPTATLTLPEAAQPQTGLTHITVYWEPIGHPPAPFLVPHFDFHFYTISSGERLAVDCADTSKPPALPSGYSLPDMTLPPDRAKMVGVSTLVGICVPQMGMHSLPTTQLESTTPFRGTMIIGYYHGKPIFVEPMLSQAMLMEKADFNLPIPFVAGMAGNYPRAFRAEYDDQQRVYRFVFADFTAGT
jgi:hypothetical protein